MWVDHTDFRQLDNTDRTAQEKTTETLGRHEDQALGGRQREPSWRDRLREGLQELSERRGALPAALANWVRQVAAGAEQRADVALEVTLQPAQRLGRVLLEPVRDCLVSPDLEFAHATLSARGKSKSGNADESVGIVATSAIPNMRATAAPRNLFHSCT